MRWFRFLLWLLSLGLAFLAGYYLARRPHLAPVLRVNAEMVPKEEMDLNLQVYRKQALDAVILERLVAEKARSLGVTVEASELELPHISQPDPELSRVFTLQARTTALLRKLVLKACKPKDRQEVYDNFRPQLCLYQFQTFLLSDSPDLQRLQTEIKQGIPFEAIRKEFARPESWQSLLVNRQQLRELVGSQPLASLTELKPGQSCGPIASSAGRMVFCLQEKQDSYQQLLPAIEEILYQSRVRLYSQELGVESAAQYLTAVPLPREQTESTAGPSVLPKPRAGSALPELPKPRTQPSR